MQCIGNQFRISELQCIYSVVHGLIPCLTFSFAVPLCVCLRRYSILLRVLYTILFWWTFLTRSFDFVSWIPKRLVYNWNGRINNHHLLHKLGRLELCPNYATLLPLNCNESYIITLRYKQQASRQIPFKQFVYVCFVFWFDYGSILIVHHPTSTTTTARTSRTHRSGHHYQTSYVY